MSAVWTKALADLRRRRLQGCVIGLVVMLSSIAAAMAVSLLVESDAPFDRAFAESRGAHLTVRFDSAKVSEVQVLATSRLSSVTAMAGPWPEVPLEIRPALGPQVPIDILGRADPGGRVDKLQLRAGRWSQSPGEVVLAQRLSRSAGYAVGDTVAVLPGQGVGPLMVVGIAAAVGDAADGWVTPAQAASMHPVGGAGGTLAPSSPEVAMYRLRSPSARADIDAAIEQITGATSAAAIRETTDWIDQRRGADTTTAVMIPFLLAFSGFALAATAMIVGNVVSGAVIAGYREIGIMKSVGFTPFQVVATLTIQTLVPALLGAVPGIAAGIGASQPFLADTAAAFDLPQAGEATPAVAAACLATVVALVAGATLIPGIRAARKNAAEAIAAGSAPGAVGGRRVARVMARLPLPLALSLGATDAAARPVRSGMTLVAVALGATTITFALGLTLSLDLVRHALTRDRAVQVSVVREGQGGKGFGGSAPLSDQQATELIETQAGTARVAAEGQLRVHVGGIGQQVTLFGYRGESSWVGYTLLSGRWFRRPGEAVAPQALLDAAHRRVGETVAVNYEGRQEDLLVVGAIFDQQDGNLLLRADWSALESLGPGLEPRTYEVQVIGVDPRQYAQRLQAAAANPSLAVRTRDGGLETAFALIQGVLAGLALVLTGIALAGVFNTVVLNTREKARDTAILRALGMPPRQVMTMVLTSVVMIGLAGVAAGILGGRGLERQILTVMGRVAASTPVPGAFYEVYTVAALLALGGASLAVAIAGAWLPATWAASARLSAVLGAE